MAEVSGVQGALAELFDRYTNGSLSPEEYVSSVQGMQQQAPEYFQEAVNTPMVNSSGAFNLNLPRSGGGDSRSMAGWSPGAQASSEAFGDLEFRAELDDQMSWNALARLGYDPKVGKVIKPEWDGQSKSDVFVAATFTPDNDTATLQQMFRNEGTSPRDASRIEADNIVLTSNVAEPPIWSHEYTHRGLNMLRDRASEDSDEFVSQYGQRAYDLLANSQSSEYMTEMLDDMEAETTGPVNMNMSQTTKAGYRPAGSSAGFAGTNRSELQAVLKDTPGNSSWFQKGPDKRNLGEQGIMQAAKDMMRAQGEPEQATYRNTNINSKDPLKIRPDGWETFAGLFK